jgi:hypothetical protein
MYMLKHLRSVIHTSLYLALLSSLISHSALADPTVEITSVPNYAEDGFLSGTVRGIDFASHRVAVYIQIEGAGWWTKPTFDNPTVPIESDGTFTADVATGGIDNRATIYYVALVKYDVDPPPARGTHRVPANLQSLAVDCVERYGRTFRFAERTWAVKEAPEPVGPGQNRFSDRLEDVFVDKDGLHLTINFRDGFWWATEVILLDSVGYGTYSFQTNSRADILDVNATFGAFTWDPYGDEESIPRSPNREIDFEDSRWGNTANPTNAEMVVQPYDVPSNLRRYTIPDLSGDPALTRFFTWERNRIKFVVLRGHHSPEDFTQENVIDEYVYTTDPSLNHFVPTEGRQRFRFNLWLNNVGLGGTPPPKPASELPVEVVITDFSFVPAREIRGCRHNCP